MKPLLAVLARIAVVSFVGSLLIEVPSAQLFGPQKIISTAANVPPWVHAADLDGDGDQDVRFSLCLL